jgi:hypothetical protein
MTAQRAIPIIAMLIAGCFVLGAPTARAHGGGLNSEGCHNERRTGGYHCHRGARRAAPLGAYNSAPSVARSSDVVIAAQTLLNHLGCDAGVADGQAGLQTRAAAARFASATGRSGTQVDAALVRRLAEAVAAGERC